MTSEVLPEGMVVIEVPDMTGLSPPAPKRKHLAYDLGYLERDPTRCGNRGRRHGGDEELCLVFFWYDKQAKLAAHWLGENPNINVHWGATSSVNIVSNPTEEDIIMLVTEEERNRTEREIYIQEALQLQGPEPQTLAETWNVFRYIQGLIKLDKGINSLYNDYFSKAVPAAEAAEDMLVAAQAAEAAATDMLVAAQAPAAPPLGWKPPKRSSSSSSDDGEGARKTKKRKKPSKKSRIKPKSKRKMKTSNAKKSRGNKMRRNKMRRNKTKKNRKYKR